MAVLVVLQAGDGARAEESVADRRAVQERLESVDDLNSRARAVLFRARGRHQDGEFAEAARIVQGWLDGDPARGHRLLWLQLGQSRLELGDDAGAQAAATKATELAPDFARAWLLRGDAAYRNGDLAEAERSLAAAWRLLPERPMELAASLAALQVRLDRPEDALARMETVFAQAPDSLRLDWYRTAVAAALAADQPPRVRPHVDRLLRLAPSDPDAWDLAYRFAAGHDDHEAAASYLTIKGYLQPLTADEERRLGDLCAALDAPGQAARHYEAALRAGGGRPEDHERLAAAWLAAHEADRARAALQAGLEAGPTARLWSLLGDLEFRDGDFVAALAAFTRACDLDPDRGRDWLMRGWSAAELGQDAVARESLRRAADFADQAATARRLLQRLDAAP